MPNLGGPLAAFQMGQEIGRARSPVTGLGQAIRNILDTARQGGLLQAQSLYQAQGSNLTNVLKEDREKIAGEEMTRTIFVNPVTGAKVPIEHKVSEKATAFTLPTPSTFQQAIDYKNSLEQPKIPTGEDNTLSEKARAYLTENGALATPANIEAVIKRGLVK